MMRAAPLPLCFVVCLLSAVHLCSAQTDFDIRNKEGLSRNPAGLTLLLKTEAERQGVPRTLRSAWTTIMLNGGLNMSS
jgi:hypothetical protein